jgi:hypothetical protein
MIGDATVPTRQETSVSQPTLGLFENTRDTNLHSSEQMVEDVLLELGHFLNDARIEQPGARRAWRVFKGSASVRITLIDRDDFVHLRVVAPIMTTDDSVDLAALYRRLLTMNADEIHGAAFAVAGPEVQLVAERSTIDLDRGEVLDLVRRIQSYADEYDDNLVANFGGRLGGAE